MSNGTKPSPFLKDEVIRDIAYSTFVSQFREKFDKGKAEHKTPIMTKNCFPHAVEEVLDLMSYITNEAERYNLVRECLEDPIFTDKEKISRLREIMLLPKVEEKVPEVVVGPISDYIRDMEARIRQLEVAAISSPPR